MSQALLVTNITPVKSPPSFLAMCNVYPIRLRRHGLKTGHLVTRCNLEISDKRQAGSHLVSLYMRQVPPLPLWLPCNAMWRHQAAVQCRLNGPLVSCSPDTSPSSPSPRHPHSLLFCTLCAMCGMCPQITKQGNLVC